MWRIMWCTYVVALGFNLEPRAPVLKLGKRGTYFGYSVAQHQTVDEMTGKVANSMLLVGAPRAQTTQPGTNRSGAVFSCPLTSHSKDCQTLQIDQESTPPMDDILKDDQWLGVTLKSQGPGGPVMTCAHRYVHKGPDFQWGQGICYSLSQYLDLRRAWEPCHNRPVTKAHEQFGYCQAGTSGDISEDANIVIGAPGPYTWRGTVFTNSIHFRMRDDKTWNLGPLLDDVAPVDKYSYLGMSVTSGRFFKGEMNFVGGAPRANGTGQVVFFRKQLSDSTFEVVHVLNGEQFASSFGYTLTSLDLNNDSLVDLVVGAPFYYAKGEGGAVYIYLNSPEGLVLPPIKLTGKVESRFGFSMSTLGDINKDGYTDLAIGAPYEGSGAVYVYLGSPEGIITEPSQVLRVEDLPKFTRSYVTTFGYSLSGGLDLDNNTYPDLLVGAFQNDTVLLIRSRPIIDITTSVEGDLTNIDPTQPGCAMDPNSTLVCFSFEACFTLASGVVNGPVRLRYHIEAEPGRKVSRVKFAGSLHTDTPHVLDREVTLRHRSRHCSRELAYLKEKSDIQHPVAMMLSYSLLQKEPRMPLDGEPLPDLGRFPILNRREALRRFEAKFLKDCGSDEICESNLHLRAELDLPRSGNGSYDLHLGEKQLLLVVNVTNTAEPAYDTALYLFHSSQLSFIGRSLLRGEQVECFPQNATVLKCELGNPMTRGELEFQIKMSPKMVGDHETELDFRLLLNTTSKETTPEDDQVQLKALIIRTAELELRGVADPEQVIYSRGDPGELIYEEDAGPEVNHTYQIINNGPWHVPELRLVINWPWRLADSKEDSYLLYVLASPTVIGDGFCTLELDSVNPLRLKSRPPPLPTPPTPKPTDSPEEDYDDLYSLPDRRRRRRDLAMYSGPEELRKGSRELRTETLDCDHEGLECIKILCVLYRLQAGGDVVVKIRSRLWNATFVEMYPSYDMVLLRSRGKILVDPSYRIHQSEENDVAQVEMRAYPSISLYQKPEEIPWWVIILSVCLGIFLLALLVFLLWKFGFFKRKIPDYTASKSMSEKEKEANNL